MRRSFKMTDAQINKRIKKLEETTESAIESYLVERVKNLGGKSYKWVSPGNAGVPDRIVFMPEGGIELVEVKRRNGKLSEIQERQKTTLMELGTEVWIVESKADVDHLFGTGGFKTAVEKQIEAMFYFLCNVNASKAYGIIYAHPLILDAGHGLDEPEVITRLCELCTHNIQEELERKTQEDLQE